MLFSTGIALRSQAEELHVADAHLYLNLSNSCYFRPTEIFPLIAIFMFPKREQSNNTTETDCNIFKLKFAICGYALRVYFVLVERIAIAFAKQSSDRDTVLSRFRHNLCLFFWLSLRRWIFNQKHKIFRNNADGQENESENVSAALRYIRWFITIISHVLALF